VEADLAGGKNLRDAASASCASEPNLEPALEPRTRDASQGTPSEGIPRDMTAAIAA
jgi:hypothetical protein